MKQIIVIGYGHPDRGDDAVGPLAAHELRRAGCRHEVRTCHGDGTELMRAWSGFSTALILDSFRTGAEAGTIYRLEGSRLIDHAACSASSTHFIGLREAVMLGRLLDCLPTRLVLFGVEGREYGIGKRPCRAVLEAVPLLIRAVLEEIEKGHGRNRAPAQELAV